MSNLITKSVHSIFLHKHFPWTYLCLFQGADVNSSQHEHGYSALHFAVLSGNSDVCQLLLCAGAKSYATNSVGKTPTQMAAFVGKVPNQ